MVCYGLGIYLVTIAIPIKRGLKVEMRVYQLADGSVTIAIPIKRGLKEQP